LTVNQKAKYSSDLSSEPVLDLRRRSGRYPRSNLGSAFPLSRRKHAGRSANLDAVFSALSDPTRRAMLQRLSQGEVSVTELAKPFQISLPAVSKHLHVLESAGLLRREREGRFHILRLDPTPLISTVGWIEEYRPLWETQMNALSAYLEANAKEKEEP
jgi:DNA-binding transcriptional ArsR family regulator